MLSPAAYHALRRCAQILVVLFFCILPWLNTGDAHRQALARGSLFALDLGGLPFADPAAALQVAASGHAPTGRLLLGAVLSLALALSLGRVFCSWICPYGLLSQLIHVVRRGRGGRRKAGSSPRRATLGAAFACKAVLLILALAGAAVWAYPLVSLLSMPGELSLWPLSVWQGASLLFLLFFLAVPVAALLLEAFSGKRLWCRFVCPQSVLLGLAAHCLPAKMPGLRIAWHAGRCACQGEAPCRQACSLGLNPRQAAGPPRRDCVMCGDCLKACATRGRALRWQFGSGSEARPPCSGPAEMSGPGHGTGK